MTSDQVERYLYHDCLLLALWVRELTDWPVVQIFERSDGDGEWVVRHALVRMPDGRLLDVAGPHDDYSGDEPFNPADWELSGDEEDEWEVWNMSDVADAAGDLLAEVTGA